MLPRRHRATAVADFPEQLAVGLLLHLAGRPVGRLRIERGRRGAIALSLRTMARHAVHLRYLFALLHALLVRRQRVLLRFLGGRRLPRGLGHDRNGEEQWREQSDCGATCREPSGHELFPPLCCALSRAVWWTCRTKHPA